MNLEFINIETVLKLKDICIELAITPEDFILKAIIKLLQRNYVNIIVKKS